MRIETCFFCSKPAYPSKGIALMRNSGDMKRFCSSKCHKNFKMKRNPRKLKWTKAYRKAAGKEMVVDSTLQFAARRNVPVRYDRELVQKTVAAMSRISEIRAKRERAFYMRRIRGKRAQKLREARRLVADNEHLLPRLRGSEKRKLREMGVEEEEIEEMERIRRGDKNAAAAENGGEVFGEEKKRLKAKAKVRITVDGDEVMEMPDGEEVSDDGWGGVEDEDTMDIDV